MPFEVEGGLPLVLLRALFVAGLLSSFGALLFWTAVVPRAVLRAPAGVAAGVHRALRRVCRASLGVTGAALLGWAGLQAAIVAESAAPAAVGAVLRDTAFGHLAVLQAAALAGAAALLGRGGIRWRRTGATVCAGLATALQAGHGHALALADGPSLLLGASVLHLLAAGGWLGGLLPLLLAVRAAPARTGAAAARWFSPLGKGCVAGVALSAVLQFYVLIGGLPGLAGTPYGSVAVAKAVLFAILFGFAWANRYGLAPRLLAPAGERNKPALLASIAVQTGFGVAVVVAASLLSSLPPAVHEQPSWPFALRPSLAILSDPDGAAEVGRGAAELACGAVLLGAALLLRRRRLIAAAALLSGLGLGAASATHLELLLVEAYPTSYFTSPTGFAAAGITRGAALFAQHCATCHGADGRGDGPAARSLPVPPADLTAGHLWEHSDGELFWWLSHGIDAPEGGLAMPGFADTLSEDDRWALIDYVRAHNAGAGLRDTGRWAVPVAMPGFSMDCSGGRTVPSTDLRGRVLHVVALPPGAPPPPPGPDQVLTVLLSQGTEAATTPGSCTDADPAVWAAFGIVAGVPAAQLAGTELLVDGNGWLRAVQRPGAAARWTDPALLAADARQIARHPIAAPGGGGHHH